MIGTDSHTPNAGGLGMIAVGVGGLDATETMAGLPWELLYPKRIGVKLTGESKRMDSPKGCYIKSSRRTNCFRAELIQSLNILARELNPLAVQEKPPLCNMGAEVGATCSIFPL